MSDESAFLTAITASPEDDTARLVYADWLQDRGDPRAEYLRLEVKRHRMTPRELRKDDPFHQLEGLRKHALPDWLSRIDRTTRYSAFWPQPVCQAVERDDIVGFPLALVESRGNHNTRFPKGLTAGDYCYVFAFRGRLLLVGRMRINQRLETALGASATFTIGIAGIEGTPIRFDRVVTDEALSRLSWFSGKTKVRGLSLNAEGQLSSPTAVSGILRLTPRTAADLDAILRGDSLS